MTEAEQLALIRRHTDSLARLQTRAADAAVSVWNGMGRWTGPDVADEWLSTIRVVDGAATTAAHEATVAYVAQLAEQPAPVIPAPTSAELRGVVTSAPTMIQANDPWLRPLIGMWRGIGDGTPFVDAMAAASRRVRTTAATNVTLASRHATMTSCSLLGMRYYRRVLRGTSCAFCATASTQRYRVGNLAPLHSNCDCGWVPVFATHDPGWVLNRELLERIKQEAMRNGDDPYWITRRFRVTEDGELVPAVAEVETTELGPSFTE